MSSPANLDVGAAERTPPPLELDNPSAYAQRLLVRPRDGPGWPDTLVLGKTIARGSNSTVHRAALIPVPANTRCVDERAAVPRKKKHRGGAPDGADGAPAKPRGWVDVLDDEVIESAVRLARQRGPLAVRTPRHASDTRMMSHATWEFETTALAARHGVAPTLYDAFYAKHTTSRQRRGLHLMTRWYPMDLRTAVVRFHDAWDDGVLQDLGRRLLAHVEQLARMGIFHFDLKAQNVVVDADATDVRDVRILDFGKEFCQRRGSDHMALWRHIDKLVDREQWAGPRARNAEHVAKLAMLALFSCVISHELNDARIDFKTLDATARAALNPLRDIVRDEFDAAPPVAIRCAREVLRDDEVRDLLRHYCGAHNACTKRVFRMAGVA